MPLEAELWITLCSLKAGSGALVPSFTQLSEATFMALSSIAKWTTLSCPSVHAQERNQSNELSTSITGTLDCKMTFKTFFLWEIIIHVNVAKN